ncbi:TetR/AcrR family transcriptional regulator [Bacillus seohaeanensis]|jgi:AcrR family transcriptional regulator|uniref:TetR/AcrR family transcriptional regulator n=1 Tax=Bacillus seohaeanensis TaxID=284580 RepID=A0ABW5RVN2_9BACI
MKDMIMETGIQLFGEKGFKETSIQDLMDELKVTKGTFYYYYKSKEELLKDIHLQYINRLVQHQESIINDESLNCEQKLYQIIYSLIHDIKKEGLTAKVFFREMRHLSDENLDVIVSKRDKFRLNIQSIVEEGIVADEFRSDLPADIVTFGILGIANWSYFWFQPDGEKTDEQVSKIFHEILVQGMNGPKNS